MQVRQTTHGSFDLRVRSVTSVLVVVAVWELAARLHFVSALFLPPFTIVASQLWAAIADGSLAADLAISLSRACGGLAAATLVGTTVGIAMARVRVVDW